MEITKAVMDALKCRISGMPPETGGIIGSHDNKTVDEVILDLPDPANTRPCAYFPNVDFLNRHIAVWQNSGVFFKGVFHTHFMGVRTLSCGDISYINTIMDTMPPQIDTLYFPLFVLPDRELVCYTATRVNGTVDLYAEDVIIK